MKKLQISELQKTITAPNGSQYGFCSVTNGKEVIPLVLVTGEDAAALMLNHGGALCVLSPVKRPEELQENFGDELTETLVAARQGPCIFSAPEFHADFTPIEFHAVMWHEFQHGLDFKDGLHTKLPTATMEFRADMAAAWNISTAAVAGMLTKTKVKLLELGSQTVVADTLFNDRLKYAKQGYTRTIFIGLFRMFRNLFKGA